MIIQIGTEIDESRILWKHKETDEWTRADIDDLIRAYESMHDMDRDLYDIIENIEELLSAEPKTNKWIFNPKDAIESMFTLYKCPKCGFESADCGNFCPNCGKRMKGGEEE